MRTLILPDRYSLMRAVMIVAVVLAAPVAGYIVTSRRIDPTFVLGGLVGLLLLLLWQRRASRMANSHLYETGILAVMLAGGMISFFTLPTGRESRIVISLVITLGLIAHWLIVSLRHERRVPLRPSPITRPLLSFVAVSVIAYFWSYVFRDPNMFVWSSFPFVQLAALLVNVTLPLLLLFVANKIDDVIWLKRMVAVMVGLGALSIALYFTATPVHDWFMYRGTRGLFGMWVGVLALALAFFHRGLPKWVRVLLLGLAFVLVYRYFFLGRTWVTGWLPLGVGLLIVLFARSKRLFLVVAVIGAIYIGLNFDFYYNNIVVSEEEEGSGSGRVELWVRNLNHVVHHPLFGMGPAGYAIYNMTYHPTDARSTHNNYFDVLAQTGIIGASMYLWLFGTLIVLAQRTRRAMRGRSDFLEAFSVATMAGSISVMIGMMLGDWVLPFAYNQTISGFDNAAFSWILLGAMVALYHLNQDGRVPSLLPSES